MSHGSTTPVCWSREAEVRFRAARPAVDPFDREVHRQVGGFGAHGVAQVVGVRHQFSPCAVRATAGCLGAAGLSAPADGGARSGDTRSFARARALVLFTVPSATSS